MKITFDKDADAAYIYLTEDIGYGEAVRTISLNEDINLDFDSNKKLLGVEILNASKNLQKSQKLKISDDYQKSLIFEVPEKLAG